MFLVIHLCGVFYSEFCFLDEISLRPNYLFNSELAKCLLIWLLVVSIEIIVISQVLFTFLC